MTGDQSNVGGAHRFLADSDGEDDIDNEEETFSPSKCAHSLGPFLRLKHRNRSKNEGEMRYSTGHSSLHLIQQVDPARFRQPRRFVRGSWALRQSGGAPEYLQRQRRHNPASRLRRDRDRRLGDRYGVCLLVSHVRCAMSLVTRLIPEPVGFGELTTSSSLTSASKACTSSTKACCTSRLISVASSFTDSSPQAQGGFKLQERNAEKENEDSRIDLDCFFQHLEE